MVEIKKCLVCGSESFFPILQCVDHSVSKETFGIIQCNSCSFKVTSPRPLNNELGAYYKSEDYVSHNNSNTGIINKLYQLVKKRALKTKFGIVRSYVSRGTILDYGCGTGSFLSVCKKNGWETFGIEPDDGARKLACTETVNLFQDKTTLLRLVPEQKFEVISLWHVLEHVTDITETLQFFKSKLQKEGILFVAVPNVISYDACHYKENWAAYDVPRHLYHFEKKTIKALVEPFGFQLRETIPMKFDSFYVSILSEKYKSGKVDIIKGLLLGLKSNLWANSSDKFSSTIYVFSHK